MLNEYTRSFNSLPSMQSASVLCGLCSFLVILYDEKCQIKKQNVSYMFGRMHANCVKINKILMKDYSSKSNIKYLPHD